MKVATRPAPSVPKGATNQNNRFQSSTGKKPVGEVKPKKKPPPRPPPPKFNNSVLWDKTWDFPSSSNSYNQNVSKKHDFTTSLIDLSIDDDFFKQPAVPIQPVSNFPNDAYKFKPPIAATKPQVNNFSVGKSSFFGVKANNSNNVNYLDLQSPSTGPTIIRVQPRADYRSKVNYGAVKPLTSDQRQYFDSNYSPPMPSIPPPSPPKFLNQAAAFDDTLPHGVALYQFVPSQKHDLSLEVDDIVILLGKINEEWVYGKVGDSEGMFPINFIDVRVPLSHQRNNTVTALYQFNPESVDDLKLEPGQKINVLKKISQDWLFGESNGLLGQFPANFVDHIPYLL